MLIRSFVFFACGATMSAAAAATFHVNPVATPGGDGREHPIRNNVFSRCQIGMSIDCRGMTWKHWNSAEHGGSSWLLEIGRASCRERV